MGVLVREKEVGVEYLLEDLYLVMGKGTGPLIRSMSYTALNALQRAPLRDSPCT